MIEIFFHQQLHKQKTQIKIFKNSSPPPSAPIKSTKISKIQYQRIKIKIVVCVFF